MIRNFVVLTFVLMLSACHVSIGKKPDRVTKHDLRHIEFVLAQKSKTDANGRVFRHADGGTQVELTTLDRSDISKFQDYLTSLEYVELNGSELLSKTSIGPLDVTLRDGKKAYISIINSCSSIVLRDRFGAVGYFKVDDFDECKALFRDLYKNE